MPFINHDGFICTEDEALFNTHNSAFRAGEGLIETMLYIENGIRFFDLHMQRLTGSLAAIEFPAINGAYLLNEIQKTLAINQNFGQTVIRCEFFRNSADEHLHFLIETRASEHAFTQWPGQAITLGISPGVKKNYDSISHLKTASRLRYRIAITDAEKNGWDDSFLLNAEGRVVESTHSNIFIVSGSKIYTPPLTEGCIDGIFRKHLLSLNFAPTIWFEEKALTVDMLQQADEIFLTNAIRGLQPVGSINGKSYPSFVTRKIFDHINQGQSL